ncbi:hypothetical protein [Streptomyces sp. NPDC090026]|uniref:hypothetical protein n=1 Tax=Streptomyces sp. NPDC090026 TaxID=3365923 RepID=UPI0037FDEE20
MTDSCPRCLASTDPQHPADDPTRYVCRACGHTWTTNHLEAAWAPPTDTYATHDDPDAWEANDPPTPNHHDPRWTAPHTEPHHPPDDPWADTAVARILATEPQHTVTLHRLDQPPELP